MTFSVFSSTKWSRGRGEFIGGREVSSNFDTKAGKISHASDFPIDPNSNPSFDIKQTSLPYGLQSTISQLQNQMKQLQPGDGDSSSTDLRWKLNRLEKEKVELSSKFNEERATFESHVTRLRAQLEKGEALRQTLEYELAVAKKEASVVKCTSEDRIDSIHKVHAQLK
eukprot:g42299.t1